MALKISGIRSGFTQYWEGMYIRDTRVRVSFQKKTIRKMCIRDRIKSAKALYKEYVNKGLTTEPPFKGVGTQYKIGRAHV